MTELLQALGDNIVPVVAIAGGLIAGCAFPAWLVYRKAELDAELKREMIARGMSADEIVQVLEAGNGKHRGKCSGKDSSDFQPSDAR
jgi:hypothetical protein